MAKTLYIGRFAPSPTGPLHMGSLIAALASYLDAKANNGQWLLRMEDLGPPREVAGAAEAIIASISNHGFEWDGPLLYQSSKLDRYHSFVDQLIDNKQAFYCICSRRESETEHGTYNGHCRNSHQKPDRDFAIRLLVEPGSLTLLDQIQDRLYQQLDTSVGDFIIQRKDGLIAYQLAVVVDDADQQISHVIRGSDLLDSTPRQILLQQVLGFETPHYAHIPVISDATGNKLSKQTHAKPIDDKLAIDNLRYALAFLNQPQPLEGSNVQQLLTSAIDNWQINAIPKTKHISETSIKAP